MKSTIIGIAIFFAAAPASAQSANAGDPVAGGTIFSQVASAAPNFGSHYTPTMRRQELALAIALRDEAEALQAADGGTLSPRNQRYIRRKATEILGY